MTLFPMGTLHVSKQAIITEHNRITFLALFLWFAALVNIADVGPQCIGLHKLFWTSRTLVFELRVMFHFVPLQFIEAWHNSLANRTGDVQSFFLSCRIWNDQPLPTMGGVVNSKIWQAKENFFTALEVAFEGRATVACVVTPKVMSSCKSLVAFLALEGLLKAGDFIATVFKLLLVHVGP